MPLRPSRLRFHLEAQTPLYFPPLKAENIWRGMAGLLLPRAAPAAASALFAPVWPGGPSGYGTPPKPFLFRAFHLDGQRFLPGQILHVDVHVFAPHLPVRDSLAAAFDLLEQEGLGPGRGRLRVTAITAPPFHTEAIPVTEEIRVELETPTRCAADPLIFLPRLRERINALTACYSDESLLPPLPVLDLVLAEDQTVPASRSRYSTRTGQTYDNGGRTGVFLYRGTLDAVLPILQLGQATGLAGGWFRMLVPPSK